ncbi:uncharacterized protein PG986_000140 [Apiospora aurea]|uniref:Uncharacterized protein n=1 Tax=Apiospora aurea TaxID=335848 RepID=A0ABR1QT60_9PEZI
MPSTVCRVQLKVILAHCLANDEFRILRQQLKGLVRQAINETPSPERVSIEFNSIALDLQNVLEDRFSNAVAQFTTKLNKVQQKRDLPRKVRWPDRSRESTITRYLFLAEGPAAWALREILAHYNSSLRVQTVAIVFLGTENRPGNDTTTYDRAIEDYLDYRYSLGKGKPKRQEATARKRPVDLDLNAKLAAVFRQIDVRYADCAQTTDFGAPTSWRMTTIYGGTGASLVLENVDDIASDLCTIINESSRVVTTETAFEFHQDRKRTEVDIVKFKRQGRAKLMLIADSMTDSTHPFDPHHPFGVPFISGQQMEVASATNDLTYKLDRQVVAIPTRMSMYWSKDGQDSLTLGAWPYEFEEHFGVLKSANDAPPSLELELDMESALALTYLGHYEQASSQLCDILDRAKTIRNESQDNSTEKGLILAITRETSFRYAVCLMRMGNYSQARDQLKELAPMDEECRNFSTHQPLHDILNQYVLQVNTYRMRELIEAYLGSYEHLQLQPSDRHSAKALQYLRKFLDANNVDLLKDSLFRSLELTVMVTSAKIMVLQGDYRSARASLKTTLEDLTLQMGSENLTTLEAMLYYAQSLVHTGNPGDAITMCKDVGNVLKANFDENHPLRFEAYRIQAQAYRSQGEPTDALCKTQEVLRMMSGITSFGATMEKRSTHPLALRCLSQIGSLQMYFGTYDTAEDTLKVAWDNVSREAEQEGISISPLGVECLSGLAWARCHLGKHKEAESNIGECLHRQLRFYWPQLGLAVRWDGTTAKDRIRRSGLIRALWGRIRSENGSMDGLKVNQQLHPSLIFTLHVVSQIELREEQPEWPFLNEINATVLAGFELRLKGEDEEEEHEWTMRARLAIGHAQLAQARTIPSNNSKAYETFDSVLQRFFPESKEAGSHPLALHARREALMSGMLAREDPSDAELRATRDELRATFTNSWRSLGGASPDTLMSLFYLLSLEVILDDPQAAATKDRLLAQLGKPHVLGQRFVETLALHERVAQLYWGFEEHKTCREVVERMQSYYQKSSILPGDEMREAAKAIVERAELLLQESSVGTEKHIN